MFQEKGCDRCGDCLVLCPELALDREEARAEISRLIDGEPSEVLVRCASCLSCNSYCPKACNPYDLILSRWNDRYHRVGAPSVWKFVCPTEKTNLWSTMHAILPERARGILCEWMTARPTETIFLPGSFFHLFPEVLHGSRLLEGARTMALPGHWECGAYLHQGGYLDVVAAIGKMVGDDMDAWGVKRVIQALDAVHVMFTRVQPQNSGVPFTQCVDNFHDWILQRFREGRLLITRPLGTVVTLHDNCYAKAFGDRAFDRARELLDLAGVRVTEMRHCRFDALCCGFGRGAGWRSNARIPFDILRGTVRRIREAEETGVDTLVTYCAGCFWLLLAVAELLDSPVRVVHLVELVREAMGETVDFPRKDRAWDILAAMAGQIAGGIGRRNFRIEEVRAEIDPQAWGARSRPFLKAFRRSLDTWAGRRAFRTAFDGLRRTLG